MDFALISLCFSRSSLCPQISFIIQHIRAQPLLIVIARLRIAQTVAVIIVVA